MPQYQDINIDKNSKPKILKAGKMYLSGNEDDNNIPEGVSGGTSIAQINNSNNNEHNNNEENYMPREVNRTKANVNELLSNIKEKQLYEDSNENIPQEDEEEEENIVIPQKEKFTLDKYFNFGSFFKTVIIIAIVYWIFTIPAFQHFVNNSIFGIIINPNNKFLLIILYGLVIGIVASLLLNSF